MTPSVSIIISNRNDVAMLAVTVRSCLEELKSLGSGEIVIVDNSDDAIFEQVKSAIPSGYIKEGKIKLLRQPFPCLFTARETAIKNASAPYVLCLDSHMVIGHNMILDLVNFMDRHKSDSTMGFAHAPISWAHQHERAAKHDRDMSKHELGTWNTAYQSERTITWKGMPWICRRDWFLGPLGGYGALSKHRVSWGGGDMHIGIKPWLLGFKNWAVPTSPAIHIGPFPSIDRGPNKHIVKPANSSNPYRYRLYNKSGEFPHTFGFLVSCFVLGGEEMMKRNEKALTERFGRFLDVKRWWNKAIELGKEEREWLLKEQKISFEQFLVQKPWENAFNAQEIYKKWLSKSSDHRYLRPRRWAELEKLINEQDIHTVLEFGSGVSTLLFSAKGLKVTSFETDSRYIGFVSSFNPKDVNFNLWDNSNHINLDHYDLALVDGALPRTHQLELSLAHADFIAIDDFVGRHRNTLESMLTNHSRINDESNFLAIFVKKDCLKTKQTGATR